jgi:hypothetical protein
MLQVQVLPGSPSYFVINDLWEISREKDSLRLDFANSGNFPYIQLDMTG